MPPLKKRGFGVLGKFLDVTKGKIIERSPVTGRPEIRKVLDASDYLSELNPSEVDQDREWDVQ